MLGSTCQSGQLHDPVDVRIIFGKIRSHGRGVSFVVNISGCEVGRILAFDILRSRGWYILLLLFSQFSDCELSSFIVLLRFSSPFPLNLGQRILSDPSFIRPFFQDLHEHPIILEVWLEGNCCDQSWEQLPPLSLEFRSDWI